MVFISSQGDVITDRVNGFDHPSEKLYIAMRRKHQKARRWRNYSYEEIRAREKTNLDIFWLRAKSLIELDKTKYFFKRVK